MSREARAVLVALGGAALGGCDAVVGPVCAAIEQPALVVEVRDSGTNAPVVGGARVVATSGAYADTVDATGGVGGAYALAHERAGTYTVTVERAGYRTWSRSGIRVSRDECHVRTELVTARLQR